MCVCYRMEAPLMTNLGGSSDRGLSKNWIACKASKAQRSVWLTTRANRKRPTHTPATAAPRTLTRLKAATAAISTAKTARRFWFATDIVPGLWQLYPNAGSAAACIAVRRLLQTVAVACFRTRRARKPGALSSR